MAEGRPGRDGLRRAAVQETNGTKIKICGLSRQEDIFYVNEARPDYCGFVIEVPRSRRNVTESQLRRLRANLAEGIVPVGVFVNADLELAAGLLKDGTIAMAQLHGQEDEDYVRRLRELTGCPLIQAFSVSEERDLERAFSSSADYILLDHGKGGTGWRFDWKILERRIPWESGAGKPFFLAGGLDSKNIPQAVRRCRPWAVDLSSSVETDGRKDREKILAAVAAVRSMEK